MIEAQVGNGLEGDIALDDLAVLDENCASISSQGKVISSAVESCQYTSLF